ncbi:SDR family oxidoreductase [Alphaproteobacteria bacterium]|jgi:NAD(P)-dependent dehydrogenase (short-subunit alcohol dehydrogenase family)|nr:SDR family oxidoreductase [Alphaproteobacteria bacterium]
MSKTLLITGANRGIGFEMTKQAAERGDHVIACARNVMEAPDLVALARGNPAISLLGLDVTAEADMKQIAAGMTLKIDILVCNAGILNGYGGLEDPAHHSRAIESVLMTNIAGVFFTARSFLPHLLESADGDSHQSGMTGKIAVISSIMGSQERASSNAPIYRASKAGATNIARTLAVELAPRGVAVGSYHPGWVRTDMGGDAADVTPADSAAGLLARIDALDLATTGIYESYRGEALPF